MAPRGGGCVVAGQFRQAEVEHFHPAVCVHLDIRRLQIAVNDALLVRRFDGFGDLPRNRQRLVQRNRPARNTVRERVALDEFENQRAHGCLRWACRRTLLETVDSADVGMCQRGQHLRFTLEARQPLGIV